MDPNPEPQSQPEKATRPWAPWAIGIGLLLAGVAVGWIGPALLLKPLAGEPAPTQTERPLIPIYRATVPGEPAKATAAPGQAAELIWKLKNAGNTTWTPDKYWFSPVDGAETTTVLPLPAGEVHRTVDYIQPDEWVTVTARPTAPERPGLWLVSWQLMGPEGPVPGGLIKGEVTIGP